jgi:drug/metabolite transporter (DMT)-like permease
MISLLLAIVFFALILVLFKLFEKYNVDNLQAIVINYAVAGGIGYFAFEEQLSFTEIIELNWMPYAAVIGTLFIIVFNLLAFSTQKIGFAISSIANKMSVILPVIASIYLYNDSSNWLKIFGIGLAILGLVLSSIKKKSISFNPKYSWIIIAIFLGQGVSDIIFNYVQQKFLAIHEAPLLMAIIFLTAFVIGTCYLMLQLSLKKTKLAPKNILWGIAMGVPNYLTVYYFFKALESDMLESSQLYPILNMGIIIASALIGFFIFREKLSALNWIGVFISLIAIGAIGFS